MTKELLFSVTKKDFEIQTFRSGGAGGQNQNKVSSGVRIIHKDSGARGEARDSRDQHQNKKEAFKRLTQSKVFQAWIKIKTNELIQDQEKLKDKVAQMMLPQHLKVEYQQEDGGWGTFPNGPVD
jgi:protein subunit release factor B